MANNHHSDADDHNFKFIGKTFKALNERQSGIKNAMSLDARAQCRAGFEILIPTAIAIGKGEDPETSPATKLRAFDQLGKYGYGKVNVVLDDAEFMKIVGRICMRHLPDRAAAKLFLVDLIAAINDHFA